MYKIQQAIIVEGKYDKQKVLSVIDTIVIQTNGFRIFKDESKKAYIKKLANEKGIIILTDSDSAGFLIRNHLKSFISDDKIQNAYIKPTKGKERRKAVSSKEGLLGVEGIEASEILEAIKSCAKEEKLNESTFTVADLFNLGLTGKPDSKKNKEALLSELGLPKYISNKDLIKYLNSNLNSEELYEILRKINL